MGGVQSLSFRERIRKVNPESRFVVRTPSEEREYQTKKRKQKMEKKHREAGITGVIIRPQDVELKEEKKRERQAIKEEEERLKRHLEGVKRRQEQSKFEGSDEYRKALMEGNLDELIKQRELKNLGYVEYHHQQYQKQLQREREEQLMEMRRKGLGQLKPNRTSLGGGGGGGGRASSPNRARGGAARRKRK